MSIRDVLVSNMITESKVKQATTLEAFHHQKMREFTDDKAKLIQLETNLATLKADFAAMSETAKYTDEWRQLSDSIDDAIREITDIKSDKRRIDYFLDVGETLFQYFDAQESLASGATATAPTVHRTPSNSVLSYFEVPAVVEMPSPSKKASTVDSTEGLNRDKMLEKYLSIVNPSAIKGGVMPGSGIEPGWGSCATCGVEMTFYQNEALLGCPSCGREEFILVDSEKPSYKDPPREVTYFAYKKINHFNEWLAQFQAKENTDIPQDVIESVMRELRKERISDPKKLKKDKIREVLQKLKFSKMYDHVQQIKNKIQQQMTMLTLSKEMEEKLQHMFKEIQPAFIKYCPANRSNFLSYPYVLYKLCQLLEMDEFLPCFQLLKSREKLYQQDQVWQKICQEMRWEFIRSI